MFRPIDASVAKKKTALQREAQFSAKAQQILRALYPRLRALEVSRARHSLRTRQVTLTLVHEHHIAQLARDKELIRAALRREGIDVRSVSVERA